MLSDLDHLRHATLGQEAAQLQSTSQAAAAAAVKVDHTPKNPAVPVVVGRAAHIHIHHIEAEMRLAVHWVPHTEAGTHFVAAVKLSHLKQAVTAGSYYFGLLAGIDLPFDLVGTVLRLVRTDIGLVFALIESTAEVVGQTVNSVAQ